MKKLLMTLIVALAFSGSIYAQSYESNWPDVDYGLYESSDYLPFYVSLNGVQVTFDDNWAAIEVAVFANETLRGHDFLTDKYLYEDPEGCYSGYPLMEGLLIGYNSTGEVLSFKIYDHSTNTLYDGTSSIEVKTGEDHYELWFCGEDPEIDDPIFIDGTPAATGYQLTINPHNGEAGHYYLISSPIGTIAPGSVEGMIASVEEEYDLYMFSQTPDADGYEWYNYKAGMFGELIAGKGYLYASKNGTTLIFNGDAYTGTGTFDLDYAEGNDFTGVNIMGNPFAVAATVDLPFYTLTNSNEYSDVHPAGSTVEAMVGVVVESTAAGQQVTFTPEGGKKSANAAFSITHNGNFVDRAMMVFDGKELSKIQLNPNHTKIYMPVNGKDYAVASVESFGEMPVNFKAENDGTYTLNFTSEEVNFNYLHLIDNMTGADVDLLVNPAYTFDANRSDYANRFKLVFATSDASNSDFAFVSNGNIIVNGEGLLQVIDMTGRIISSEQISGVSSIKLNAAAGVYVLQLNGNTQKIVVK